MRAITGIVKEAFDVREPSARERQIGEWAEKRGLFLWLGVDDEGNDYADLGVEEWVNGKCLCHWISLPRTDRVWPEALPHFEKLVRAGLDRLKDEQARFPWWEHVP